MTEFDGIAEPNDEDEDALDASVKQWREQEADEPLHASAEILAAVLGDAEA